MYILRLWCAGISCRLPPFSRSRTHFRWFLRGELDLWAFMRGVTLDFSRPGKPTENEFRPVIEPDRLWAAHLRNNPFEGVDDIAAAETLPHIDRRRQPGKGVDDGQRADLAPVEQLVVDKIHCPHLVGRSWCRTVLAQQIALTRRLGDLLRNCRPISRLFLRWDIVHLWLARINAARVSPDVLGLKIFGIAVGLLILMAAVALMSMRMTRMVDAQLTIIDHNYFPAYVALAQANIRSVEESAYARRLLLAIAERGDNAAKSDELRQRLAQTGKASDEELAIARMHINQQIADPLDFEDNIALARLDDAVGGLQADRRDYESVLAKLLAAAISGHQRQASDLLAELDGRRDDFDHKIDAARTEMRQLASAAIVGTKLSSALSRSASRYLRLPRHSASPSPPPSRSASCARCAACSSAPPPSRVARSTREPLHVAKENCHLAA
jgi:hypothetical protein